MQRFFPLNIPMIRGLVALVGMVLMLGVGWRISSGLIIQDVLVALIAVAGVVLVLLSGRGIRLGFFLWIGMFALGYRTMHVTQYFSIHPLEAYIGVLLILIFLRLTKFEHRTLHWVIPGVVWAFVPFWIWGILPRILYGVPLDYTLAQFINFLDLLPILGVMSYILEDDEAWKPTIAVFFGTGALIALVGIIEYQVPIAGIRQFAAAPLFGVASHQVAAFNRAFFDIWGSPTACFVFLLSLPMIIPLWYWYAQNWQRVAIMVGFVIQAVGIYIAGYRSIWAISAIAAVVILVVYRGWVGGLLGGTGLGFTYLILPVSAQVRFQSLLAAMQGDFQDTSSLDRWNRMVNAFNLMLAQPQGVGWRGAGWVHSDFAQLGADLGLVGGLIFLGWYVYTCWLLIRLHTYLRPNPDQYVLILGLVGSFVGAGGMLLCEGVTWLPQTAIPVWFVWALIIIRWHRFQQGTPGGQLVVNEARA